MSNFSTHLTCGLCGDKCEDMSQHDCWVRRKIDTQDYFPEPESQSVPLGE